MANFDWQAQLEKRRRRTKYERIGTLILLVFILGFSLWRIFYANTPEYALEKLGSAIESHDAGKVQAYCDINSVVEHAYDDLTRDMFAQDARLSDQTKVMFEQFYIKIKPQVTEGTCQLITAYVQNGSWLQPGGDNLLKGRQLGIDYEYLVERSQLRNTKFVKIESVSHTKDTAMAKVQVKDEYTGTLFTLNLLLNQKDDNWQVTKILNYRDFLDFIGPIQTSGLMAYTRATQNIIDKYNDILDTQQTNFKKMTATEDGRLTSTQRSKLAGYIKSDIIPALEKRQQELDEIPVNDGAQYLKEMRSQEARLSIESWQHFLTGIENDNTSELNLAKALHAEALDIQHRIEDLLKNSAVSRISKTIP